MPQLYFQSDIAWESSFLVTPPLQAASGLLSGYTSMISFGFFLLIYLMMET